ncbi:MAG TPA: hypothetical protein VD862_03240 [Candidatus Paceibacterota bacterium]|nr:hypothetical protein [Candidatus Paceibacterota bacterium]
MASEALPVRQEQGDLEHLSADELSRLESLVADYKAESPPLDSFSDIYPAQEIAQDTKDLGEFVSKFERLDTPLDRERELHASAMEMALMEFSSLWMPGYLSRASQFDDIRRQTDLILEDEGGDGVVRRIAIDVTMSDRKAKEKMFVTLQRVLAGWFHDPKYFESELEDIHEKAAELKKRLAAEGVVQWKDQEGHIKKLMEMPRVIIGTNEKKDNVQIARLYLKYRDAQTPEDRALFRRRIAELPIGGQFRRLIEAQLRGYVTVMQILAERAYADDRQDLEEKIAYMQALLDEFREFGKTKDPGPPLAAGSNKVAVSIAKELSLTLGELGQPTPAAANA